MDILSPLPPIAILLTAAATAKLLARWGVAPPPNARFSAIDGLRGYLALFVFLCHCSIWYFYLRTGRWGFPDSHLFTHFGQSGVALFFMITSFLFTSKLLNSGERGIDWARLFVSRVMRLTPLYLVAFVLVCLFVGILSGWTLREPVPHLLSNALRWIAFTIPGAPNLNGVDETSVTIAGVWWSLPYEWFFYLALPLLAAALRVRVAVPLLFVSVGSLFAFSMWGPEFLPILSFAGGMAAAWLVRREWFNRFATSGFSSLVIIACAVFLVWRFDTAQGLQPLLVLSVIFALIAGGNSLFGLLVNPASRLLGDIGYGIYLLHGFCLFVLFHWVLGYEVARNLSPTAYWLSALIVTPVLVTISFLAFKFIEHPAMQKVDRAAARLRGFSRRRDQPVGSAAAGGVKFDV